MSAIEFIDSRLNVKYLNLPEIESKFNVLGLTEEDKGYLFRCANLKDDNPINNCFLLPAVTLYPEFKPLIEDDKHWIRAKKDTSNALKTIIMHRQLQQNMDYDSDHYSYFNQQLIQAKLVFPNRFPELIDENKNVFNMEIDKLDRSYSRKSLEFGGEDNPLIAASRFIRDAYTLKVLQPEKINSPEFTERWNKLNYNNNYLTQVLQKHYDDLNNNYVYTWHLADIKILAPELLNNFNFKKIKNNPREYFDKVTKNNPLDAFNLFLPALTLYILFSDKVSVANNGLEFTNPPVNKIINVKSTIIPLERSFA